MNSSTDSFNYNINAVLPVAIIAIGALLLTTLINYYNTIAFVNRNTVTHLSKLLFIILFLSVLNVVCFGYKENFMNL